MKPKLPLLLLLLLIGAPSISAQAGATKCPPPFPAAKFYIENQPDSPIAIRDFNAEHVRNPGDVMAYDRIRVTFYFENRGQKKIESYSWDTPDPNESKWSGGADLRPLLPGESQRNKDTFHTQNGPSIVFRITDVTFDDGTEWKARRYRKSEALKTKPICVVPEVWPQTLTKRTLTGSGWSEPVFADRVSKSIDAGVDVIDGVRVQVKLHEIKRERLDAVESCAPDEMMGRILGKGRGFDFDIEKYRSYWLDGRVFAFLVQYEYVDEARQSEIGAGGASFYVDKTGNGKFSLDCNARNLTPSLPGWIKKVGAG